MTGFQDEVSIVLEEHSALLLRNPCFNAFSDRQYVLLFAQGINLELFAGNSLQIWAEQKVVLPVWWVSVYLQDYRSLPAVVILIVVPREAGLNLGCTMSLHLWLLSWSVMPILFMPTDFQLLSTITSQFITNLNNFVSLECKEVFCRRNLFKHIPLFETPYQTPIGISLQVNFCCLFFSLCNLSPQHLCTLSQ